MRTIVFLVAAVNAPRLWGALPERGRWAAGLVAAALSAAVLTAAAALSGPILDGLDVSPSTFRIAAGVIMLAGGVARLLDPLADPEPSAEGWRAGIVPLAFPLVLAPDVVLLAVSAGADDGAVVTAVAAVVALATLVVGAVVPRRSTGSAVVVGAARLLGAILVVGGVALAVDGIQDL